MTVNIGFQQTKATIQEQNPGTVNADLKPEEGAIAMQRKLRADRRAARAAEPLIVRNPRSKLPEQ